MASDALGARVVVQCVSLPSSPSPPSQILTAFSRINELSLRSEDLVIAATAPEGDVSPALEAEAPEPEVPEPAEGILMAALGCRSCFHLIYSCMCACVLAVLQSPA